MELSVEKNKTLATLHDEISDNMLEILALLNALSYLEETSFKQSSLIEITRKYAKRIFNKAVKCRQILGV